VRADRRQTGSGDVGQERRFRLSHADSVGPRQAESGNQSGLQAGGHRFDPGTLHRRTKPNPGLRLLRITVEAQMRSVMWSVHTAGESHAPERLTAAGASGEDVLFSRRPPESRARPEPAFAGVGVALGSTRSGVADPTDARTRTGDRAALTVVMISSASTSGGGICAASSSDLSSTYAHTVEIELRALVEFLVYPATERVRLLAFMALPRPVPRDEVVEAFTRERLRLEGEVLVRAEVVHRACTRARLGGARRVRLGVGLDGRVDEVRELRPARVATTRAPRARARRPSRFPSRQG
jgi:hypothetical protein